MRQLQSKTKRSLVYELHSTLPYVSLPQRHDWVWESQTNHMFFSIHILSLLPLNPSTSPSMKCGFACAPILSYFSLSFFIREEDSLYLSNFISSCGTFLSISTLLKLRDSDCSTKRMLIKILIIGSHVNSQSSNSKIVCCSGRSWGYNNHDRLFPIL